MSYTAVIVSGIVGLLLAGCDSQQDTVRKAETISELACIGSAIIDVSFKNDELPPLEARSLVDWLTKHSAREACPDMRIVGGILVDTWGHPVMLQVEDGRLVRLASVGANGRWDEGGGDDIAGGILELPTGVGTSHGMVD